MAQGSFFEIVDNYQGTNVVFNGKEHYIGRARLGEHLQLAQLGERFDKAREPAEKSKLLLSYLERVKVDISQASPGEVIFAYAKLRSLNGWHHTPAWLDNKEVDEVKKTSPYAPKKRGLPYAYEGRFWAFWIHKIASRYHWSKAEILSLWPEEAALYIQEILLSEYEDRENERALSQLSYNFDAQTGAGRFIPSPMPPWMVDEDIPEAVVYKKSMLPVGAVEASYTRALFNGNGEGDE
jgi:hypothetical protein